MSVGSTASAALALRRFGLGPRPGDLARIGNDPQGALLDELSNPAAAHLDGPDLVPANVAYGLNRLAEEQRRINRAKVAAAPGTPLPPDPGTENALYKVEARARFARLVSSDQGLLERLVLFWSNHFAVAMSKGNQVVVTAGPMEREAIRPHILGPFKEMVRAVEQHPAMLFYLDNAQSIGPNSRNGNGSTHGLNENLAREIMELHTLGVDGGYTQADVTSLARIITGWTVNTPDDDGLYGGHFTFAFDRHEPGDQVLLGKTYPAGGLAQGQAALDDLATHPATAQHIARQLAAHFVDDNPPQSLVDRLTQTFTDTGGDLGAVTRALVLSDEAWTPDATKMRSPIEFVVAAARLVGTHGDPFNILSPLQPLGQPLWNPSGPNGFPDRSDAWATPEGMKTRLDVVSRIASGVAADPMALLAAAYGTDVSPVTTQAVQRAESRQQGVAILLMAPEFQRR
jgi:uncharacterized protein (DUF1800 family)